MATPEPIKAGAPATESGYAGIAPPPWGAFLSNSGDDVPELNWPQSTAIYHKMRTDSQINALLLSVYLPIRRRQWGIDPNGAREEIVVQVAQDMGLPILGTDEDPGRNRRRRFNHDDHLRHTLLALAYGCMFFNQVGDVMPDDNGVLRWRLRKLAPRMPQSIAQIRVAPDGGLLGINQYGGVATPTGTRSGISYIGSSFTGTPIDVSELVAYVWDREGANWSGRSMLRPLYRHWLIKDRLIRVDAMKNERFGMGIPFGKAPKGSNRETVAAYGALATQARADAAAGVGLPDGAQVGVAGVSGSLPDIIASLRYHDEAMARSFLAMFLQLGQTHSGARALGEEFIDFFQLAVDAVATWYAQITNEHVIEDWVDWNYGVDEAAPVIGWLDDSEEHVPLAAADLVSLIDSGVLVVDDELRAWARDHWDITHGGTGPSVVTPAPTVVPTAARRSWTRVVHGRREHITVMVPHHPPVAASAQTLRRPTVGHREPTTIEAAAGVDFATMQAQWASTTEGLIAAWAPIRAAQIDAIVASIEDAARAGSTAALASVAAPVMGQDAIGDAMMAAAEQAVSAARAEAAAQGVTIELIDSAEFEAIVRARAEAMAALMARSLAEAGARQALNRYGVNNITPEEVAAGVRDHLESMTDAYLQDQLGGAVSQAQNTGRAAVFARGPAARYYASELLDTNTCDACASMDKTEFTSLADAQSQYPSGGYAECFGGPRCRGTIVAVFEEESTATVAD